MDIILQIADDVKQTHEKTHLKLREKILALILRFFSILQHYLKN